MSIVTKSKVLVITCFLIALPEMAVQQKYECEDFSVPKTKIFQNISEYKTNKFDFRNGSTNFVKFSTPVIQVLEKNMFIAYKSVYIRKLTLSNKNVSAIQAGAFFQLYCVRYLELQDNSIADIFNGTFDGLDNLEYLNLSNNIIFDLPSKTFYNLTHLKFLDLSHNRITAIHNFSLEGLNTLSMLNLAYNHIEKIEPEGLQHTASLKNLQLGNNEIQSFGIEVFKNLIILDILNISNNKISEVDKAFAELKNLSTLVLDGNVITDLNVELLHKNIPRLTRVGINNCSWMCDTLLKVIRNCESKRMSCLYDTKEIFVVPNVYGIICKPDHIMATTQSDFSVSDKHTGSVVTTTSVTVTTAASTAASTSTVTTVSNKSSAECLLPRAVTHTDVLSVVKEIKTLIIVLLVLSTIIHLAFCVYKTGIFKKFQRTREGPRALFSDSLENNESSLNLVSS